MSCLVKTKSIADLSPNRLDKIIDEFKKVLKGKVDAAYIFGSVADGSFHKDSDIDVILVCDSVKDLDFLKRPLRFNDLFEIYPRIDLLVYTSEEFESKMQDADLGFWKSVKNSMKQIV